MATGNQVRRRCVSAPRRKTTDGGPCDLTPRQPRRTLKPAPRVRRLTQARFVDHAFCGNSLDRNSTRTPQTATAIHSLALVHHQRLLAVAVVVDDLFRRRLSNHERIQQQRDFTVTEFRLAGALPANLSVANSLASAAVFRSASRSRIFVPMRNCPSRNRDVTRVDILEGRSAASAALPSEENSTTAPLPVHASVRRCGPHTLFCATELPALKVRRSAATSLLARPPSPPHGETAWLLKRNQSHRS